MFTNVKVTCKASEERMARIDPHSLVFENGKNYVVAVDGDGSLQVKEVEIYKRSDKEMHDLRFQVLPEAIRFLTKMFCWFIML